MGRFGPTGQIEDAAVNHSVAELPWGVLRGARGPSDGSAGASSNVPSALAVLRHAQLYLGFPAEIEDAFEVLENHGIDGGHLYPVAVATLPFLFDVVRRNSPIAERVAELLARISAARDPAEPRLHERLATVVASHSEEIARWIGRYDRAACALAIHVPDVRDELLVEIARADRLEPEVLLALVDFDLGAAPGRTIELALAMLDGADTSAFARACAAAFLVRFGERSPSLASRLDSALPPSAPHELCSFVHRLWTPSIERPVVAPRMYDAEVVAADVRHVLVRAGTRSVTLPWERANVRPGERVQIGLTTHGQPKLVVVTTPDGSVKVIDF
jgi:hypothetical protein